MTKKRSILLSVTLAFLLLGLLPYAAAGAATHDPGQNYEGDFFIISSVNRRSKELFLKAPTEVTELMLVNERTVFLNDQGKRIQFQDLRAGDTVYVISRRSSPGLPVAIRIQKGPMTLSVLHNRYLEFK
jgi:hypothetical protein